jgi:hypothetical protein
MVTGSRDWTELSVIRMALAAFYPGRTGDWLAPTIVHGDARGADRMASEIAKRMGYGVEAHPADWERHGKRAGPIRNREMLDSGVGSPATPAMPWNGDATGWTTAHKTTADQTMSDLAASYDGRVRFVSLDSLESAGVGAAENFTDDVHYNSTGNGKIAKLVLDEIARAGGVPQNIGAPSRILAASNTWPEWSEPRGKVAIDSAGGVAYVANGIDYTTKVALWIPVGEPVPVTKTADYTSVLQDQGGLIEMNSATGKTVTIPPNGSVAFPIGASIELVRYGAGTLTVAAGVESRSTRRGRC